MLYILYFTLPKMIGNTFINFTRAGDTYRSIPRLNCTAQFNFNKQMWANYVLNKFKMYFWKKIIVLQCRVFLREKKMPETVCVCMVFNRNRSHFMTGSEGDEPPLQCIFRTGPGNFLWCCVRLPQTNSAIFSLIWKYVPWNSSATSNKPYTIPFNVNFCGTAW